MIGNGYIVTFRSMERCRDGSEQFSDLFFIYFRVYITDNNHTLQIGTVPFAIEIPQYIRMERFQQFYIPDHIATGKFTMVV